MKRKLLGALCIGVLSATSAMATVMDATFTGTFSTGATFSGSFSYDTSLYPSSNSTFDHNGALQDFSVTSTFFQSVIGTSTVTIQGQNDFRVFGDDYQNGANGYDGMQVIAQWAPSSFFTIDLDFPLGTYASNDLPTSLPALSQATAKQAFFTWNTGAYAIQGTLTSFKATPEATAPVPETATWMMMIAGFGAVGASLRRRRVAFA